MVLPIRILALCLASTGFAACAQSAQPAGSASVPASSAAVSALGRPGAIALTDAQAAEVRAAVQRVEPVRRTHLRYAFAQDENGKARLVVYDDLGLGSSGKTGRKGEYIIFKVLNSSDGSHYDPQQNAVIAAIPAPPDRDMTFERR
ncbi:MAG: hypothetical protein ABR591_01735 [Candidatus Velthaea sp.]